MGQDNVLNWRDGVTWIEGSSSTDIASTHGTPIFVVSETKLRSNARRFQTAFRSSWPGATVNVLPSIKANYLLALRAILTEEGMGCDTFGPGELHAAQCAAVPPHLVSVNGSVKSRDLIRQAIDYGARITLDSVNEATVIIEEARAAGAVAKVRVRVRPDYSRLTDPTDFADDGTSVHEAASRYKPGIPLEDLKQLGPKLLATQEVDFCGVMAHIGRHRNDLDFWRGMIASYVELIGPLIRAWDWLPREIDVGGGFATPRDPTARLMAAHAARPAEDLAPSIEEYAEVVGSTLAEALEAHGIDPTPITLEVEPGRSMFADAGIHLTKVLNVKQESYPGGRRTWVETDTTEMFLTDGVLEHSRFVPLVASGGQTGEVLVADVVGMSCQFDLIAGDVSLNASVAAGDLLLLLDTGAYLEASATNFNALPRPATVLVCRDQHEIIKRAETVEDVFARDSIPQRLLVSSLPVDPSDKRKNTSQGS